MTRLLLIAAVVTAGLGVASVAEAREGCGVGLHRGPRGHCIANRAGGYYKGFGYWDGRRYYQHRERYHGGWRYR